MTPSEQNPATSIGTVLDDLKSIKMSRHGSVNRYRSLSVAPFESFGYGLSRSHSTQRLNDSMHGYRSRSVDPSLLSRSLDETNNGYYDYLRGRKRRSSTMGPSSLSSTYFDRYSELPASRQISRNASLGIRPIIDGYYHHFRPYYWYSTAPRVVSYFYPYSDWRYTSRYQTRTPSLYSSHNIKSDNSYVWRLHGALTSVRSLQTSARDLAYLRAMRNMSTSNALSSSPNRSYYPNSLYDNFSNRQFLIRPYA